MVSSETPFFPFLTLAVIMLGYWYVGEDNSPLLGIQKKTYKPSEKGYPCFFMAVSVQQVVVLDGMPAGETEKFFRRMPVSELLKHS